MYSFPYGMVMNQPYDLGVWLLNRWPGIDPRMVHYNIIDDTLQKS